VGVRAKSGEDLWLKAPKSKMQVLMRFRKRATILTSFGDKRNFVCHSKYSNKKVDNSRQPLTLTPLPIMGEGITPTPLNQLCHFLAQSNTIVLPSVLRINMGHIRQEYVWYGCFVGWQFAIVI